MFEKKKKKKKKKKYGWFKTCWRDTTVQVPKVQLVGSSI